MSISDQMETDLLALIFNATPIANVADNAVTSPLTDIAVALHTADPTDSGNLSSNEIAYTSYARVNHPRNTGGSGWQVTADHVNPEVDIVFPAGTGGSGTATHWSTGKTGGGAAIAHFQGTVTPNIVCGDGVTPRLTTATQITLA